MTDRQKAESAIGLIQMEAQDLRKAWDDLKAIEGAVADAMVTIADEIERVGGERPEQ